MPDTNKIQFGLRNVYYAKITATAEDGTPTYGTPVRIPGGVNLSLSAEGGSDNPFYADDIIYFNSFSNNGYTGSLEVAMLPASFYTDILGDTVDATTGIRAEKADATPSEFALFFEFQGDKNATRHCSLRCSCNRPEITGATKEDNITPQTTTVDITSMPRLNDQAVIYHCERGAAAYDTWFNAVPTI